MLGCWLRKILVETEACYFANYARAEGLLASWQRNMLGCWLRKILVEAEACYFANYAGAKGLLPCWIDWYKRREGIKGQLL
jgi:hypothetical protein